MDRRALGGGRRRPPLDLDDVMYGIHAVNEAILAGERLRKIHVGDDRRRDPALRPLLAAAQEAGLTIRFESRAFFAQFPYKAHQSVVAFGEPFEYITLEEAVALRKGSGSSLYVVLDHITDPHNCGAIIRTAECAGATALLLPERRSAGVNGTVRKAAAGAASLLPIARVANVATTLRAMKKAGIWIAGADVGEGSQAYTSVDLRGDIALVIGAEGAGISPVVRKECDFVISIPLVGKTESLNASVAAGVLLYEARRQRDAAANPLTP